MTMTTSSNRASESQSGFPLWTIAPVLVLALAPACPSAIAAGADGLRAGVARVDITPPVGGLTAGYAAAAPTDGVHDPLSARVLVLESNGRAIAMVSMDLCVFNSPRLHERAKNLGVDHLLLMNTHTHAGPKMDQGNFPGEGESWKTVVEDRVENAIREALANMFRARVAAGEGELALGYNRLLRRGEHAVTMFENPDHIPYGPVDPTVGVIRVADHDDKIRAVLVVYACHPVILGPRNRKISADYPGVTRDRVEAELGEGATCIFIQGAGGDINPLRMARGENRDGDFEIVRRVGERLAAEVLEVLRAMNDQPGRSSSAAALSRPVVVPHRFDQNAEVRLGTTSVLINDEIGIVTMPGEPFHRFGVDLRARSGLPHAYLFGYCCDGPYDWPSYLPDIESAARGGYGASDTTRAEVGAGERLLDAGIVGLHTLRGRLKPEPRRHTFENPD